MSTARKLPQDFPIKVKVPSEAKMELGVNMIGSLVQPFVRLATVTALWNRWGRTAFGIERKLTFRQALAINAAVAAIARTAEISVKFSQNEREDRKKRLKESTDKVLAANLGAVIRDLKGLQK